MLADAAASTLLASALLFPVLTRHSDDLLSGVSKCDMIFENVDRELQKDTQMRMTAMFCLIW
jgi:hypothetical protein